VGDEPSNNAETSMNKTQPRPSAPEHRLPHSHTTQSYDCAITNPALADPARQSVARRRRRDGLALVLRRDRV
jgi:hypothetical protein